MQHDIIVAGAGLAGMVAALTAAEAGASVLLIDKGAIGMGSNSAISNAAFMSPTRTFSKEAYVFVAILYFLGCFSMSNYSRKLEKELSRGN